MYDVIFAIMDDVKGPVTLYSSLPSNEDSQRIAVKAFIAIGAMEQDQDLQGRQAVVPFPGLGRLAFYTMFPVPTNDGKTQWAALGFIGDTENSIEFYKSLPNSQKLLSDIVSVFQRNFKYLGIDQSKLSPDLINSLTSLRHADKEGAVEKPTIAMPGKATVSLDTLEDFKEADLSFLLEYFPRDLDKVIYSLLMEEPILLVGDIKDIVSKIVASIEILLPHRVLKKQYVSTYIDPENRDILVCSSRVSFLKKYKGLTTVDLLNRKIASRIKGVPSISNLINTLKLAPKDTQEAIIRAYIDELLAKTADLMGLCEKDQIDRSEISIFRSTLKADELNIVISMVKKYAPQMEGKLFYFARSMI
ncbi:MAG: hypothetical protein ACFFE8_09365 [Candidatus Heimdallarchaeota archaeon]